MLGLLAQGWSPEQVVGRLKLETGHTVIGCETIYRFIYAQLKRTNDGALATATCQRPSSKPRQAAQERRPVPLLPHQAPRSRRPDGRPKPPIGAQPGHWEADFMLFSAYGQNVLVLHERTSRLTLFLKTDNRRAEPTAQILGRLLDPLPQPLEAHPSPSTTAPGVRHEHSSSSAIDTFFCDPHSPWQKGGVENAIGRFRRFLPRRTNLDQPRPGPASPRPPAPTTTPRDNVWTSSPQPRSSLSRCCTSNENPHPEHFRRDEQNRGRV